MESDVQNLRRQGLIEQRSIEGHESYSKQVFTLTKKGHKLLSEQNLIPDRQAIYHGFVKAKEARHGLAQSTSASWSSLLSDLRPALDICNTPKRRRSRRRVGDPVASTGRLAHLQKVFADEAADETRGSGENQPAGKRNGTESGNRFCDSHDSVRELWHRKEFWHSFGTVRGQNGWFPEQGTWKCFIMNSALHVGA